MYKLEDLNRKKVTDLKEIAKELNIPKFEKLSDSRKKTKKIIKKKCDILILEGWCGGCPPIDQGYLYSNFNKLEKKFDRDKKWRNFYNNNLILCNL